MKLVCLWCQCGGLTWELESGVKLKGGLVNFMLKKPFSDQEKTEVQAPKTEVIGACPQVSI